MMSRSGVLLGGLLTATAFGIGWSFGTGSGAKSAPETAQVSAPNHVSVDRLIQSQSSHSSTTIVPGSGAGVSSTDPVATYLKSVPFAELKSAYLDRQDHEWKKVSDRYPSPDASQSDYAEVIAARSRGLSLALSENERFIASGEWVLRGGKRVSIKAFVQFNSSGADSKEPLSELARKGGEICWNTSIFFRLDGGGGDISESTSSCVPWAAYRNGAPIAVIGNYNSKRLAPYFDQLALPIPGAGVEGDVSPEWFDSASARWQDLTKLTWQGVTAVSYAQLEKEASAEVAPD